MSFMRNPRTPDPPSDRGYSEAAAIQVVRDNYPKLPQVVKTTHTDTAWTIWAQHPTGSREVQVTEVDRVTGRPKNLSGGNLFRL